MCDTPIDSKKNQTNRSKEIYNKIEPVLFLNFKLRSQFINFHILLISEVTLKKTFFRNFQTNPSSQTIHTITYLIRTSPKYLTILESSETRYHLNKLPRFYKIPLPDHLPFKNHPKTYIIYSTGIGPPPRTWRQIKAARRNIQQL